MALSTWKEWILLLALSAVFLVAGYRLALSVHFVDKSPDACSSCLPPSSVPGQTSDCSFELMKYESSSYESVWVKHVNEWQTDPCGRFPEQRREADVWVNFTLHATSRRPTAEAPRAIFSSFLYQNICDGSEMRLYIEPLALVTRHPYTCLRNHRPGATYHESYAADKDYLLIDWNGYKAAASGRAFYFDMGASTYDTGPGGASQKWIVDQYHNRGIDFDRIFAWEAKPYSPQDIFASIPGSLHHKYHWYNFPVSADENSDRNPWTVLQRVAKPDDFVVVKIDIDTPDLENRLVQQLLHNPKLQELIDDFYFEHHVNATPMSNFWGPIKGLYLNDTYDIFFRLRQAGIRAHSWV